MAVRKLNNYLRTFRKRGALSQDEIAYLLGCTDGGKISRYENFRREPNLQTALAYEVIFNVPVRELFAGLFEEVERKTLRRIGRLGGKLCAQPETRVVNAKLESLASALRGDSTLRKSS